MFSSYKIILFGLNIKNFFSLFDIRYYNHLLYRYNILIVLYEIIYSTLKKTLITLKCVYMIKKSL